MFKEALIVLAVVSSPISNVNQCTHGDIPSNFISSDTAPISTFSAESHPVAEGMNYYWGYDRCKAGDNSSGYYYYDLNVYYSQFTDVSRLYLINVKVDFTSGWIATQNHMSGYSDMFDLDRGHVHLAPINQFYDEGDTASSVRYLASWPSSSTSVSSVTSGFSIGYTSNWTNGGKFNWPNGVEVSTAHSSGFSLQIDHSTTITTDEPYVSTQTHPNNPLERQWNYQYKDLGKATYTLDTFYLLEVKNDSMGFNKYGFVFDIYLNMSNVQYKDLWWESHDSQSYSMRVFLGLGRNPAE